MIAAKQRVKRVRNRPPSRPRLRFTPYARAKLTFLRDIGDTEVGGFGISADDDPLRVVDFQLVTQVCTAVTVEFSDDAVADFFDSQVDAGRTPDQFARIWIHTHPGSCPLPSLTDEETFDRCFGAPDWAVMFILARQGATYGRLRLNVGPGATRRLAIGMDYGHAFAGSNHDQWQEEYAHSVTALEPFTSHRQRWAWKPQDRSHELAAGELPDAGELPEGWFAP